MNDQTSSGNPQNPPPSDFPPSNPPGGGQPPYQNWRDMRHAERAERRAERRAMRGSVGWIGGVILILLGAVFLLQNLTGFSLDNWWALFILIPAFGAFANAWNNYRMNDRLTSAGRGSLIGGFVLTLIAAAFLFNLDLGNLWPVLLIVVGLAILSNALLP